jgi:acyl-[acyl-carrier-protein]-phospholipid O-acyltransferase/long-chain-fatty-acid--[acyl-carrier-protein] ligase
VKGPNDPAVILFTSGSEGEPKGVVLSHANLMANAQQIAAYGQDFLTREVVFNPLPAFHSFGLTAGTLFGLLSGYKIVLYPSPLHFKQVPRAWRKLGCCRGGKRRFGNCVRGSNALF